LLADAASGVYKGVRNRLSAPSGRLTGQTHHAISRKVHQATEAHPNLRGQYKPKDPRFTTQGKDLASHYGYPDWHRQLDREVADWVKRHPDVTPAGFETFLRERYLQSDLVARFPKGLGGT